MRPIAKSLRCVQGYVRIIRFEQAHAAYARRSAAVRKGVIMLQKSRSLWRAEFKIQRLNFRNFVLKLP
jgi:hypothetical protein